MKSLSLEVFTFYKPAPMPQMAPMYWLFLFTLFNFSAMGAMVKLHFN